MIWLIADASEVPALAGLDARVVALDASKPAEALDAALAGGAPALVLLTGTAMAAQPGLAEGLLLFDVWGEDASFRDLAKQVCAEAGVAYQLGPIRSPSPLPADRAAFGRERRALAVDRENEAVRAWAKARGVPCFTVKSCREPLEGASPRLLSWFSEHRSRNVLRAFLKAFLGRVPAGVPS